MDDSTNLAPTSFLGTGWSFPPTFTGDTNGLRMVSGDEDIHDSLIILFGTALGERFLRPFYGLDMHGLLFEPMTTTMKTELEDRLRTAILIYEPRIDLLTLQLDASAQLEGKVTLVIDYAVRATNSRFNLVYPFYLSGGSEVRSNFANV